MVLILYGIMFHYSLLYNNDGGLVSVLWEFRVLHIQIECISSLMLGDETPNQRVIRDADVAKSLHLRM